MVTSDFPGELASLKVVVLKRSHAKDCWKRFRDSDSGGLEPEDLHSNESPGDAHAAGPWTTH